MPTDSVQEIKKNTKDFISIIQIITYDVCSGKLEFSGLLGGMRIRKTIPLGLKKGFFCYAILFFWGVPKVFVKL